MSSSGRFDPASSSEAPNLTSTYPNSQRGPYTAASLDKSASFRENSMTTGGSTTTRSDTLLYSDMPPVTQCLNLDLITLSDQKLTRVSELKRALGSTLATSSEDNSFGVLQLAKSTASATVISEDLRRFRAGLNDNSWKARERSKHLSDCISKVDKYRHALSSRKRSCSEAIINERASVLPSGDRPLSGTSSMRNGQQGHQLLGNADLLSPRSDDRSKGMLPNPRRIRSSIADGRQSEGRNSSLIRPPSFSEKEKDPCGPASGAPMQTDEKPRGLSPGGDGWEKKMNKRKRSGGVAGARSVDGEPDPKRAMQPRLTGETRTHSIDSHAFRSAANAVVGVNKIDSVAQSNNLGARATSRSDVDNASFERRDRNMGPEKVVVKGVTKPLPREGNQPLGSTLIPKMKASRAPRTAPGVSYHSASFSRPSGALEGWEPTSSLNKGQGLTGANQRKRPVPTRSSSPPVGQWAVRQQKMSRAARRSVPSTSNREESQLSTESLPVADTGSRPVSSDTNGLGALRRVPNAAQQFKLKSDSVPSPAGISESEDSGVADRPKEKGRSSSEIEERNINSIPQVANFVVPSKKSKLIVKDDIGDGVRRQGRSSRGASTSRSCLPLPRDKVDSIPIPKNRGPRPVSEKIESKSGRPPSKKISERKSSIRSGQGSSIMSDCIGEADDDSEELTNAVQLARTASTKASSSSQFWKQMEHIFASVAPESVAYLQQQKSLAKEFEGGACFQGHIDQSGQAYASDMELSVPLVSDERQNIQKYEACSNGVLGMNSEDRFQNNGFLNGIFGTGRHVQKIIPLSQRLLAAIIVKDEFEDHDYGSPDAERFGSTLGTFNCTVDISNNAANSDLGVDSLGHMKNHKYHYGEGFSHDGNITSNGFRNLKPYSITYNVELAKEENGTHLHTDVDYLEEQNKSSRFQPVNAIFPVSDSLNCSYQQMSFDDRILLELQSIGLFPESVPDLAQEEDDEINHDIANLKEGLCQQVKWKGVQVGMLESAVKKEKALEERDLEKLAMNKLVEIAYQKHMQSRGNSSGGKSGGSKIPKPVAAAFAKRTLDRCKTFEQTGTSCFSDLIKDALSPSPLCNGDAKPLGGTRDSLVGRALFDGSLGASHSGVKNSAEASGPPQNHSRRDSDPFQSQMPDHHMAKDELWSNRGKKKELLLDDLGTSSRAAADFGGVIVGGTKGKRSDREHSREMGNRSNVPKAGRPSISNVRGERKNKAKPRQKTAQLSTSVNGLLGRNVDGPDTMTNTSRRSTGTSGSAARGSALDDPNGPIDLSSLPLPEIDEIGGGELGPHGGDFEDWLDCENTLPDDGAQDEAFMGLSVPMDDLLTVLQ